MDFKYGTKAHPNIVRYFEKTPSTIVCPHFYELNWGYGCPFSCAYCYLQGTLRGQKYPRHKPLNHIFFTLDQVFNDKLPASVFNSGELTDSLAFPSIMEKIVDKFEEQDQHKLLILTKSSNIKVLLKKLRRQTIVSFSINASEVAARWEKGCPAPEKRIAAAKDVAEIGYQTRIRIDPIFPLEGWEKIYCDLIDQIFDAFEPERITLGSLRGLQKTIRYSIDHSWVKYLSDNENTGWGKKVNFGTRALIYTTIIDYLREKGFSKIAFCKETWELWKKLGLDPGSYKKNWE